MASGYSDLSEIQKDRGAYGLHQKPPKINLLNEKPRRESLIEHQLASTITRPVLNQQSTDLQQQQFTQHQALGQGSQLSANIKGPNWGRDYTSANYAVAHGPLADGSGPSGGSSRRDDSMSYNAVPYPRNATVLTKTVRTMTTSTNEQSPSSYMEIVNDLAEKEAKLKREIAYLNQQLSPWARPPQTREPRREPQPKAARSDQRWVKECPSSSSSRPTSRASSTRSTTEADLMEKAAKLMQDVEELEKKPLKTQQILIESGATSRQASRPSSSPTPSVSSVHTAIIKVPKVEVDNKSPLPFAYDNFSTLGVRGNIASVGATPPETPYPPIFPMIKRSPSPLNKRRD